MKFKKQIESNGNLSRDAYELMTALREAQNDLNMGVIQGVDKQFFEERFGSDVHRRFTALSGDWVAQISVTDGGRCFALIIEHCGSYVLGNKSISYFKKKGFTII